MSLPPVCPENHLLRGIRGSEANQGLSAGDWGRTTGFSLVPAAVEAAGRCGSVSSPNLMFVWGWWCNLLANFKLD